MLILAGDIGGTHTRLALMDAATLAPVFVRDYPSAAFAAFDDALARFLDEARADPAAAPALGPDLRACFGVAGPTSGDVARITNLPWTVDARALERRFAFAHAHVINDFHAAALGVATIPDGDRVALGGQPPEPGGTVAVVGPGTGFGVAFLVACAAGVPAHVVASEGGHADFAPRTPLEDELRSFLAARYGRASWERVLSGAGLADLFTFLAGHPGHRPRLRPDTVAAVARASDAAAAVSRLGLHGGDPVCAEALHMLASILGAVAGNLALTVLATGGVFLCGGVTAHLLPVLTAGGFRTAFEDKGRLSPVVRRIPVFAVTHPALGLRGAATLAAHPARR